MTRRTLGAFLLSLALTVGLSPAVAGPSGRVAVFSSAPLAEVDINYGQSNALNGGGDTQRISSALYPAQAQMSQPWAWVYGPSQVFSPGFIGLTGANDAAQTPGQWPATMEAFANAQFDQDYGSVSAAQNFPVYVNYTVGEGGQPLTAFLPSTAPDYLAGHYNYSNLKTFPGFQGPSIFSSIGRKAQVYFIYFTQGESGPTSGWGTMFLNELWPTMRQDVATAAGQTPLPEVLLWQINAPNNATSGSGVELDQLTVASTLQGQGLTLIGPMYGFPLVDQGGGNIHLSSLGRMMQGEVGAWVRRQRRAGNVWNATQIISAVRSRASIVVNYNNPISVDGDWVASIPNDGFLFTYNGAAQTIASVAKTGPAQMTVTLAADPGAHATEVLRYAEDGQGATVATWAGCRGLIYTPSTVSSVYYRKGYSVPQFLRFYAVRQAVSVS